MDTYVDRYITYNSISFFLYFVKFKNQSVNDVNIFVNEIYYFTNVMIHNINIIYK